jgi:hypothetical protein
MPENIPKKSNLSVVNTIINSSITRVIAVLIILTLYTIFLSPKVESILTKNLGIVVRQNSTVEVNSLSPLFDIYIYAGEYNLSSTQRSSLGTSRTKFHTTDPRILAMNRFLNDYHSPMVNHAELFIIEADRYGLDWRLIVAISGVESAFGNLIPKGSHNGWGWRGRNPDERGWSQFESWDEAIEHITERMALGYGTDLTPYDIESTYCPPCGATGLNLWARGVTRFMNELEYYVDNLENL